MGHQVTGSDLKRVAPASSGCGRSASTSHVGHDADQRRRRRRGGRLHRHRRPTTPRCAAAARPGHPGAAAGPRCSPPSPPPAARSRSPAPTARRRRRRCSPSCSSRPGCDPSFIVGGEVNEIGSGAAWDDGELVRGRGRRERRHVPRAAAPRSRSSPTSSPTTSTTTATFDGARRRRSTASSPTRRARGGVRRRPGAPRALAPRPRRRHLRHRRRGADYRIVDLHAAAPACRFTSRTTATVLGDVALPVPGLHNARNAAAALVDRRCSSASPFDGRRRGAGPLRRRRPPLRVPRRGGRRHVRRRLRPPPDRGGRRAGRRPGTAAGSASSASSSPTATAARRRCGATSPTPSSTPTCSSSPTSTPPGEAPAPGRDRQAGRRRRARRPPAAAGGLAARTGPTSSPYLRAELRPGDLCLTLGRRRPHARCPTSSLGRAPAGRPAPTDASAVDEAAGRLGAAGAPRRRRSARSRPTGSAGRPRCSARSTTTRPSWPPWPPRWPAPGVAVLVVGKGSNLLVADAGFAGLAVMLGDGVRRGSTVDGRPWCAPAARGRPAGGGPAHARPPGSPGFEWAVGVPGLGRRRGAHERRRPRLRHGGARCARVRVVDLASGRGWTWCRPPTSTSATAARRRRRRRSWSWAELRLAAGRPGRRPRPRSPRSCGGGASTSPAARTPARCSPTRPATPPAGSSTRPGCKGLRLGSAEVSTKHANFIQADEGGSADDVRRPDGRGAGAGCATATGVDLVPETRLVGFGRPSAGGRVTNLAERTPAPRRSGPDRGARVATGPPGRRARRGWPRRRRRSAHRGPPAPRCA